MTSIPIDDAIDFLLDLHHPDRYRVTGSDWQEPARQLARETMSADEIRACARRELRRVLGSLAADDPAIRFLPPDELAARVLVVMRKSP